MWPGNAFCKREFGRLLNREIDGQHDILAGFGAASRLFGLPVAEAVDEHRFHARLAAQVFDRSRLRCRRRRDNPAGES